MVQALLTPDDDRDRLFRRVLWISAAAHAGLLLCAFLSSLLPHSHVVALPGVVNVSLVAAPPGEVAMPAAKPAPPPPAPKAKPVEPVAPPPPAPPKPEVQADKKLLPKESLKQPKPEPPKPKPQPAKQKPLDYQDALDSLRQEAGESPPADAPDPELMASVKAGAKPGTPGQGGDPIDALTAEWMRRVKIHVTRNWVLPPGFKRQVIQAQVSVKIDASGNVLSVELTDGSGNTFYDQTVLRAIQKASPLPAPPESGDWPFVFSPQDTL